MRLASKTGFISAAVITALLATAAPALAKEPQGRQAQKEEQQEARKAQRKDNQADQRATREKRQEQNRLQRVERQQNQKEYRFQRRQAQEQEQRQDAAAKQAAQRQEARREADQKQAAEREAARKQAAQRQEARQDLQQRRAAQRRDLREDRQDLRQRRVTLTRQRQQVLAARERDRRQKYIRQLRAQENDYRSRISALRRSNRREQARIQSDYLDRLIFQRSSLGGLNFLDNPVYYLAPAYRYGYGGSYYETSRYGANLLESAVNQGYREGYQAGRADRRDGWPPNFRSSFAYSDASFGYTGLAVSRNDYNYYFRQGFQRGYEDGYYGRSRYGRYSGSSSGVFETLLNQILNMNLL
jgi:hypothetical protein